jgi:hypothetical protein
MRVQSLRFGLVLAVAFVAAVPSHGQTPDPRLAQVLSDWKQRHAALKTARYSITGTVEFKDKVSSDDPPLPPGNPVHSRRVVLLLDLERRRLRLETSEPYIDYTGAVGRYSRRISTSAFDGKIQQGYSHKSKNGIAEGHDLGIARGDLFSLPYDPSLLPVFYAHGIVPSPHHPLGPKTYLLSPEPEGLEIRGQQTLNGQSCLVARTEPLGGAGTSVGEYWIIPDRKAAISRYVSFTDNDPWIRIDVEWNKKDIGWPDRWTMIWSSGGKVVRRYKLQVDQFEANPAVTDADFTLQATPGMKILVQDFPERGKGLHPYYPATREYQVSPSGDWEELSAVGFTTVDGKLLPPERSTWGWWVAGAAAVLGIAGFVTVWMLRRRKKISA